MPRRAGLAIAIVLWHLISRGNNRSAFFHDEDYLFYLTQLALQAGRFGCSVDVYCLITNHIHLLLMPAEKDSASLTMKHHGQWIAQHIIECYRGSGPLW